MANGSFISTPLTSSYPVRLDGVDYIDVVAGNLKFNNYSSSGKTNILARFHVDVPFGGVFTFKKDFSSPLRLNVDQFAALDIRLVGSDGNFYALAPNQHVSYKFRFDF